jgi:hypothetical protein
MNIHSILIILLTVGIGYFICACDESSSSITDTEKETGTDLKIVFLADVNNYSYESMLHIPIVETAASSDIEICWDGLTRDFQCHDMDPAADIDNATVIRIRNMSEEEIETALSQGDLQQSNIDGYLDLGTNGNSVCVNLSDFSFRGSEVSIDDEYVVSDERKYLLVLTTGTTPGVGARMMTFMTPTDGSSNTSVTLGEGCDLLDFSAELTSLKSVTVSAAGQTVLDWSDVVPPGITRVMLGFYEDVTVVDLEAQVLDLMLIATKKWELEIESTASIALNELTDEAGAPFESFDGTGTWIFALLCEQCRNPTPPFLTVLVPSKGVAK